MIFLQLLAVRVRPGYDSLFGSHGQCLHALYCWASPLSYYVGIARASRIRQRHGTGIAARWLEHMVALIRPHGPESGRWEVQGNAACSTGRSFLFCLSEQWKLWKSPVGVLMQMLGRSAKAGYYVPCMCLLAGPGHLSMCR